MPKLYYASPRDLPVIEPYPGVKGRVVHCRITDVFQDVVTYRSGLEFIEPSERIDGVILEFLEAMKASRRPV